MSKQAIVKPPIYLPSFYELEFLETLVDLLTHEGFITLPPTRSDLISALKGIQLPRNGESTLWNAERLSDALHLSYNTTVNVLFALDLKATRADLCYAGTAYFREDLEDIKNHLQEAGFLPKE